MDKKIGLILVILDVLFFVGLVVLAGFYVTDKRLVYEGLEGDGLYQIDRENDLNISLNYLSGNIDLVLLKMKNPQNNVGGKFLFTVQEPQKHVLRQINFSGYNVSDGWVKFQFSPIQLDDSENLILNLKSQDENLQQPLDVYINTSHKPAVKVYSKDNLLEGLKINSIAFLERFFVDRFFGILYIMILVAVGGLLIKNTLLNKSTA